MKLSGLILTRNEEDNVSDCIAALSFCDEIVVIDDESQDDTGKLAEKMGARVYRRSLDKDYSKQLNIGVSNTKGEWVLVLDADERVSSDLAREIQEKLSDPRDNVAFVLKRRDYFMGKWMKYGATANYDDIRLFKRGSGKWVRRVHQKYVTGGQVGKIGIPIEHFPHKTLGAFVESQNRWSSWHVIANSEEGKKPNLLKIILYPPGMFFRGYIIQKGFLDGTYGFVFAVFMSFHSFLAWSKLWLRQKK